MRGRAALLLLVAGIPLLLLAVAIVWRGSRLLADAPRQRAGMEAAAAAGQVAAVLDSTRQFLAGLAAEPDLSAAAPESCRDGAAARTGVAAGPLRRAGGAECGRCDGLRGA